MVSKTDSWRDAAASSTVQEPRRSLQLGASILAREGALPLRPPMGQQVGVTAAAVDEWGEVVLRLVLGNYDDLSEELALVIEGLIRLRGLGETR